MKFRTALIAGGIAAVALAAVNHSTTPTAGPAATQTEQWVVKDGPSFSKGYNEHWVTCRKVGTLLTTKDVLVAEADEYRVSADDPSYPYAAGKPCPAGQPRPQH
jgi:hypothetical protein